jgi:catechol 2,3-dioxygenase
LQAADRVSLSRAPIDIDPTRHGVTQCSTIYALDPSGNCFETFCGDYQPDPDGHKICAYIFGPDRV